MKFTSLLPGIEITPDHPRVCLAPGMWGGGQQSLRTGSQELLDETLSLQMRELRGRQTICLL